MAARYLRRYSYDRAFHRRHGFESFREDPKTVAAVERKLLVMSEAAIRLGDEAAILCPDQPWHKIRGTGNWIRHQYERMDLEGIWRTVQHDLPSLKVSVQRALRPPEPKLHDPSSSG